VLAAERSGADTIRSICAREAAGTPTGRPSGDACSTGALVTRPVVAGAATGEGRGAAGAQTNGHDHHQPQSGAAE
jgi:hypothetical protein